MVLLSPSRTIAESLTALATATGHALEAIWDELGYSPHERATEISDLLQQLKVVCETKLSDEQRFLNTYQQTILDTKREIQTTRAALQLDNENIDENDRTTTTKTPPQTLIDELATLEASLDGLRSIAVAAKDDLKECLATIEEAHDALGIDLDENWRDVESDLSAGRIQLFHEKRGEMKKELTTRMAAVIQLVRDCQQMMEDLRMNIEDGEHQTEETNNESSVLEHQLNRRIAGSLVRSKDGSFIMASKFRSETCVGINAMALEELMRHAAFLHSEKRRRKETLQIMGSEIAVLWEKLRIPEEEQRAFTNSVQGLGLDTIQKGEEELQRLQTIKLEQIGTLIGEARETIQYLWDQTDTPQEYRDEFAALHMRTNNGTVESELALLNDDLLKAHEEYISILQARLDQMKPILRLIERREAVVRDRLEYEDLQKDSDRLKQRGAAMTKQLMAEEKMAKRIKRDLPKLTELLLEALSEWKQVHQEDFHFKGEVYLDAMARQETDWKAYKAEEMHRKLKKKQDEKSLVDNRFQQPQPKKRPNTKPLGDNTNHAATAAAVFRVSKPINNDTAQSYLLSKPAAAPQLRTAQSHDDAEFVAAREENALPARWMGEKHPSTRF